ncbi:MAG: hypothetical protein HWE23_10265 [Rhodobacteraceae bacterium]|nr:hypothetical protein [Paracoccaceae bacterium]
MSGKYGDASTSGGIFPVPISRGVQTAKAAPLVNDSLNKGIGQGPYFEAGPGVPN